MPTELSRSSAGWARFPLRTGRTEFRVWAPHAGAHRAALDGAEHALEPTRASASTRPRSTRRRAATTTASSLDGTPLPDPCSRWQPRRAARAVAGRRPARVRLDRRRLPQPPACTTRSSTSCTSARSRRRARSTRAIPHLPALAELGVTAIELMPVAEFPGRARLGLRRRLPERRAVLLRRAARPRSGSSTPRTPLGLAVILDVVYNHVGASGAHGADGLRPVLHRRSTRRRGAQALNVDGEHCDAVREWVCQSAEGWVRDFHLDGLRLDAIHAIVDSSPEHLVAEIARRVHAADPRALVIAESGLNDPRVMRVPRARRLGLRRRLGGRLPPRAARRC